MYVYENELDVLKFWKKRFINIYPMFWIAYILLCYLISIGLEV